MFKTKYLLLFSLTVVILGSIIFFATRKKPGSYESNQLVTQKEQPTQNEQTDQQTMKITSLAFENNQPIPAKYTCDGQNINPSLAISEIPDNAQSLAFIMDDPDAPAGTWVHWVIFNIDPKSTEIAENSVPQGSVEGITSFGNTGYGGPCPPFGTHRYFFKLYALDTKLDLNSSARKENLESAMEGHLLDSTELLGLYNKK